MIDPEDKDLPLDGNMMRAAVREIVAILDRQLTDISTEEVMLTRETAVLTVGFLNALLEALERGVQNWPTPPSREH